MTHLPAITGWHWVKRGFALFRKQPMEMSTLFLAYMFCVLAMQLVPVIGQLLPLLLIPVFSMAFMQACLQVERGERVYPNLLLTGFRSPRFKRLLVLGTLYPIAIAVALGASALVDGGAFWGLMGGAAANEETLRNSGIGPAVLFSALLYIPPLMALWYSAALVAWQDMPVAKALFYSFFAVWRSGRAFLVYGLSWLLIGVMLPVVVSTLIALLAGSAGIAKLIILPVSLIMTVVMYCSFYPMYTDTFGKPGPRPATAPSEPAPPSAEA